MPETGEAVRTDDVVIFDFFVTVMAGKRSFVMHLGYRDIFWFNVGLKSWYIFIDLFEKCFISTFPWAYDDIYEKPKRRRKELQKLAKPYVKYISGSDAYISSDPEKKYNPKEYIIGSRKYKEKLYRDYLPKYPNIIGNHIF